MRPVGTLRKLIRDAHGSERLLERVKGCSTSTRRERQQKWRDREDEQAARQAREAIMEMTDAV
jgi:hypothetical protein